MYKLTLLIFSFLFQSSALAGNCDVDLEYVMSNYLQARGGYEALEKQTALRIVSTHHEGKWNPDFDLRLMKPGYMWIEAIYDDGEAIYEGFDGKRGWEKWGEKKAEYVSGDAAKGLNQGAQSPVHLYGLHHMEQLGAKVTFIGCEVVDGNPYYVVKVLSRFGTDIDYYVNRLTHRLERSHTVRPLHPTLDPTPITIEERWSDFRDVNGVLHPFGYSQWNLATNTRLSWLQVNSIEKFSSASVEFFAKPE